MPPPSQRIEAELGRPTILVNAAGVFGPIDLVKDSDPAEWIKTIMINSVAPYVTCRAFVAGMIASGWVLGTMTTQEHEMLILMLARVYQAVGSLADVLKSREIMTEEDLKAFQFAAWADNSQILKAVSQARADYIQAAKLSGVGGLPNS